MGIFPLHNWAVSIAFFFPLLFFFLFSRVQKIFPFFVIKNFSFEITRIFILLSFNRILWVASQNLKQNALKLIFILSSISHLGWLLLAYLEISTWEFYFIVYSLNLFFCLNLLKSSRKIINESFFTFRLVLLLLRVGGLPPLIGFYPKILVIVLLIKKILFFLSFFLMFASLWDLFIYSRLGLLPSLIKKRKKKWLIFPTWKEKSFFMLRISTLLLLCV